MPCQDNHPPSRQSHDNRNNSLTEMAEFALHSIDQFIVIEEAGYAIRIQVIRQGGNAMKFAFLL